MRLSGSYEKDLPLLQRAVDAYERYSSSEPDIHQVLRRGTNQTDGVVAEIVLPGHTNPFAIEHKLGRTPRFVRVVSSPSVVELLEVDRKFWSGARVLVKATAALTDRIQVAIGG